MLLAGVSDFPFRPARGETGKKQVKISCQFQDVFCFVPKALLKLVCQRKKTYSGVFIR